MEKPEVLLLDSGIIKITYPHNAHVTLGMAEAVLERCLKLTSIPRPFIITGRHMLYVDYDAYKTANYPEMVAITQAMALVTQTRVEQMLGATFMKFHKPKSPTRLFTREYEAHEWLSRFTAPDPILVPQAV